MTTDDRVILEAIEKARLDSHKGLTQKEKDINLYLNVFSDSLQYTQLNGKAINKAQLFEHTKAYFNRIKSVGHSYKAIDSYSIENNIYTEYVSQDTSVYVRAFVIFLVKWNVKRKGIYVWRIEEGNWKIISVKILEEKTKLEKGIWFLQKSNLAR